MTDRDPASIIEIEECRRPRSPRALFDFVNQIFSEFGSTEEGRTYLRYKMGLCKPLREEMYPIAIFGLAMFGERSDVTIQCHLDNRPYDCTVLDPTNGSTPAERFEMTSAIDGENDRLQMEHYETYRRAPAGIEIHAQGTRRNRRIAEHRLTGVMGAPYREQMVALAAERIAAKIEKNYSPEITFGVVLDAQIGLCQPWTLDDLIDRVARSARPLCKTRRLVIIETCHRLVLDFGQYSLQRLPIIAYAPPVEGSLDLLSRYP